MTIILDPRAKNEFHRQVEFYLQRSLEAAETFIEQFEEAYELIATFPFIGPKVDENFRKVRFKSYPFALIYSIEVDEIFIIAVAHDRRNPDYWKKRRKNNAAN